MASGTNQPGTSTGFWFLDPLVCDRVVHGSHSWAIFSSFLCIWQRNKQKETKNGMKNDVKNGYRETPGMEIIEKWSKNAFFPSGTLPKKMKMIVFRVRFCKSEVRVPFYIHFSFILSFNFEKKWKQNEMENDWKMIEKWTKNANCERPYFWSQCVI